MFYIFGFERTVKALYIDEFDVESRFGYKGCLHLFFCADKEYFGIGILFFYIARSSESGVYVTARAACGNENSICF